MKYLCLTSVKQLLKILLSYCMLILLNELSIFPEYYSILNFDTKKNLFLLINFISENNSYLNYTAIKYKSGFLL